MVKSREEILEQLNEKQATQEVDPETRELLGLLHDTIVSLSDEIAELQDQIDDLERTDERDDATNYSWYSERNK